MIDFNNPLEEVKYLGDNIEDLRPLLIAEGFERIIEYKLDSNSNSIMTLEHDPKRVIIHTNKGRVQSIRVG